MEPVEAFIAAACAVPDRPHREGTLAEAEAMLAARPGLAGASIHAAAAVAEASAVRRLLAAEPARAVERAGPYGWDPLTCLCFSRFLRLDPARAPRFVDAARALLDAGASPHTGFHTGGVFESALYGAAGVAHEPALTRLLLDRGADPNDEETPYHAPETYDNRALQALVESGRVTADSLATMLLRKCDWHDAGGVAWLLGRGADPNRITRWGKAAIHQAVLRDNPMAIVDALLDAGADPAAPWHGRTAAAWAARHGRADVLEACVRRGHPMDLAPPDDVIAACARADAAAVRDLVAARPEQRDAVLADGAELVTRFAGAGNTAGVLALLDFGVAVDARAAADGYWGLADGSTALHVAAWRGRHDTVRALLARGAAVGAEDARGRTPLMLAVAAGVDSYWRDRRSPASIAALLEAGAPARGVSAPTGWPDADRLLS